MPETSLTSPMPSAPCVQSAALQGFLSDEVLIDVLFAGYIN